MLQSPSSSAPFAHPPPSSRSFVPASELQLGTTARRYRTPFSPILPYLCNHEAHHQKHPSQTARPRHLVSRIRAISRQAAHPARASRHIRPRKTATPKPSRTDNDHRPRPSRLHSHPPKLPSLSPRHITQRRQTSVAPPTSHAVSSENQGSATSPTVRLTASVGAHPHSCYCSTPIWPRPSHPSTLGNTTSNAYAPPSSPSSTPPASWSSTCMPTTSPPTPRA